MHTTLNGNGPACAWRCGVALAMLIALASPAFALAKDKAMYVGGTVRDFPKGGIGSRVHVDFLGGVDANKVEGRITTQSPSEFVFEAGGHETLTIQYEAVAHLTYGLTLPAHGQKGGVFLVSWDPLDQFTSKAHYLLVIAFRDQAGADQFVVFELGKDLVRPTLATLEARTGKSIEFTEVGACLLCKSAGECNYGTPVELKGLTKVFVDARPDSEFRTMILAEIEKGPLHLEMLTSVDGAEIVLEFYGEEMQRPGYIQALHGGRGHVFVARDGKFRPVMQFMATRTAAWGAKPATKFGEAFSEAYRQANAR